MNCRDHLWLLILAIALSPNAGAAVLRPSGNSDAVVYNDWYGGPSQIGVFNTTAAYLHGDNNSTNNTYWNQAVFEFPVDSLAGQTALAATMHLYVSQAGATNVELRYYGAGTGTVQYRDYNLEGSVISTFDVPTIGWYSFDVSTAIQDAANHGYQWAVFCPQLDDHMKATFGASESVAYAPDITVVPEPAFLALLPCGAILCRRIRPHGWREQR